MQVPGPRLASAHAIVAVICGLIGVAGCNDSPRAASYRPNSPVPAVVTLADNAGSRPLPSLDSISPSSATAMSGAFTLSVIGANFTESSVVHWCGKARATVFVNSSLLTASINASDLAFTGTVDITVSNSASADSVSNAATFTVLSPGEAFLLVRSQAVDRLQRGFREVIHG